MQSIAHGVVLLEQLQPGVRRRSAGGCASSSTAASPFRGGYHDYVIRDGGLDVFPRLVAAEHRQTRAAGPARQRRAGARRAARRRARGRHQHAASSARPAPASRRWRRSSSPPRRPRRARGDVRLRREPANAAVALRRSCGIPLGAGTSTPAWSTVQPGRPGRADAGRVRPRRSAQAVERGAKIVVIDSLNGYLNAMPEERFLTIQLHELLMYPRPAGRGDHPDRRAPRA